MIKPRNRVVQLARYGGPDELEVVDAPLPTAGRGEVRVRVLASSVQYTDVLIQFDLRMSGSYQNRADSERFRPAPRTCRCFRGRLSGGKLARRVPEGSPCLASDGGNS